MKDQKDKVQNEAGACSPGCSCGQPSSHAGKKWMICGIVVIAAAVVVATRVSRTEKAAHQTNQQGFSAAVPTVATPEAAQAAPAVVSTTWGAPLKAMADLNNVAADYAGVFLVLPSSDPVRTATIQSEVAAAAKTINDRGTKLGTFVLSSDSKDYSAVKQQAGAPAVLALYKGGGMAVVTDKQITQDGLLKAFVSSTRPSGCGPSGCGPSSSGCN